ncbi:hypothetical protein JCM33374_g3504 [Metschnikowia sp. JCM 33374]|nr:hypothetical protein JCM33374_g3504 [Metschnikowia sp. JCM 33374]
MSSLNAYILAEIASLSLYPDIDVEFAEDIAKYDIANDDSKGSPTGSPTESARDVATGIANTSNTSTN